MTSRWPWALLLAGALLACSHPGTRVEYSGAFVFSRYPHIGVMAFTDRKGKGSLIADGIDSGLRKIGHGGADRKALEAILKGNKPDPEFGMRIEILESLRNKASADAVLSGSMASDWSAASVSMVDTESGDQVLRALVKPHDKKQKAFADADEVVRETLRIFDSLDQ